MLVFNEIYSKKKKNYKYLAPEFNYKFYKNEEKEL